MGDQAAWATIVCGLPKKASGACSAYPHCMYMGCVEITNERDERRANE